MKNLQHEAIVEQANFFNEVHELEVKCHQKNLPLYEQRQKIVNGVYEPLEAEMQEKLDKENENLSIQLGSNHLKVTKGDVTLTTKLVDGQFPDYEKVVPKDISRVLSGDTDTLKQGFLRASILSNEKYRGVRLAITPESLTIQANNPEQEEAEETVPVQFSGGQLEIGFNVSYLLDVLSVLNSGQVQMSVSDANSSALLESPENSDAVYVVMPMSL